MNGLTTETIAILTEAVLTMGIGIILALVVSWRIALVTIACSPLIFMGGVMMSKLQWKKLPRGETGEVDNYRDSNALLSDIVMNYRTIISFGEKNIDFLMKKYESFLELPLVMGRKNAHLGGFFFGYS